MRILFSVLLSVMMCIPLPVPANAQPAQWPAAPALQALSTPYGELSVRHSGYVYDSRLVLDGDEIEPTVRGIIGISYAYRVGKRNMVLISVDEGDSACPVHYHWLSLGKNGYTLSEAFGSCSDKIRVSTRRGKLLLQTPSNQDSDKIDVWAYDGQRVRRQ